MFGLEGVGEWKVEGVEKWKCEDLKRKCEESWGCLDWDMLECMCEESLLKYMSDMIVVNCKITNLSLYIRKE